jgi:hypothetical protein
LPVQGPHVLFVVLHTGLVGVVQSLFVLQSTHDPPLDEHTCPLEQSPLMQARHVLVPVSQNAVGAVQSAFDAQATQVKVVVLQIGVAPVHADLSVPSHCTQLPFFEPVISHTAFGAVQSLETHARHLSVVPSQIGVPAVQAVERADVHCTHCPARLPALSHAGVAPVQSAAMQARHTFVPVSQIGVAGVDVQSAFVVHVTCGPWTTQSFCPFDHSVCV